jgi:hypothetical protein
MDVLAFLSQLWVLAATLAVAGVVFLAEVAAEGSAPRGGAARFLLDVLSLPLGVLVLVESVLQWHALPYLALGISLVVGAILTGRSIREVPWTGVLALGAGALAGFLVDRAFPTVPFYDVLGLAAVVFLVVYAILFVIEIPLRIAGLVSVPRPMLVVAAVGSFLGAGLVYLSVVGAP